MRRVHYRFSKEAAEKLTEEDMARIDEDDIRAMLQFIKRQYRVKPEMINKIDRLFTKQARIEAPLIQKDRIMCSMSLAFAKGMKGLAEIGMQTIRDDSKYHQVFLKDASKDIDKLIPELAEVFNAYAAEEINIEDDDDGLNQARRCFEAVGFRFKTIDEKGTAGIEYEFTEDPGIHVEYNDEPQDNSAAPEVKKVLAVLQAMYRIPKHVLRDLLQAYQNRACRVDLYIRNDRAMNSTLLAFCMTMRELANHGLNGRQIFTKKWISMQNSYIGIMAQCIGHYVEEECISDEPWNDTMKRCFDTIGTNFCSSYEEDGSDRIMRDFNPTWKTDKENAGKTVLV